MSQLTTHILNTASGKPAVGIHVILEQKSGDIYKHIVTGETDSDGRIPDLLQEKQILKPGVYRLIFDTETYFKTMQQTCFYPQVTVEFNITDSTHYHVPLLLSPYGYSTYRGS